MIEKETKNEKGDVISREISSESQNSIELTQNAKGEVAWKVKVYADPEDIEKVLDDYAKTALMRKAAINELKE